MKKRALLVGINYEGTGNRLRGCINDSNNMNAFLTSKGFTDIKMILEQEATTDGIKAGLEWLVADTHPGDVIVFHYSGHGSQLPSKYEPDGFEEIICPIDLNWMDKVITDDTLRQVFDKVPNGVNTTVILDCCHSGTMLDQTESLNRDTKQLDENPFPTTKSVARKKKGDRYMKPPIKILKKLQDRELVDWETSKDVNATALLIAGCRENQTSADATIDGQAQGAATAAMLKIAKENAQISYKNLVSGMGDYMIQHRFTQVPQLDGSYSLYDQLFLEPFSFAIAPVNPATPTPIVNISDAAVAEEEKEKDNTLGLVIGAILLVVFIFTFL